MTLEELHRILLAAYKDETLLLPATDLPASPAATAIAGHWKDAVLKLVRASKPELLPDRVVVRVGTPANLETLTVPAAASSEWWIGSGGLAEMRILLTPLGQRPEGTPLVELYPILEPAFTATYRFTTVTLTIDSTAKPVDFDILQNRYAEGLYHQPTGSKVSGLLQYSGTFVWPDALKPVQALFGDSRTPTIGALRLVNGVPQYLLPVPGTLVQIGHLQLETSLDLIGLLLDRDDEQKPDTPPDVDARHRLLARIRLPDSGRVLPFETSWQIAHPQSMEIATSGINDVPGLLRQLGKQLLNVEIPDWSNIEGLPWLQTFNLAEMRVGFDVQHLRLDHISTTFTLLDSAKNFTIIQDFLTLDRITVKLSAQFGSATQLNAALTGSLTIHDSSVDGPFEVTIALPECSFRVGLGPYSSVDAGKLLRRLIPQLPDNTQLIIDDLAITGSRAKQSLSFSAAFGPGTSIDLLLFRLEEVDLYFGYSREGGVSQPSIELGALLRISEQLTINVSGTVDRDGWLLRGSLDADPPLKLAQLLPQSVTLPEEISAFEIGSVGVTVGTAGGKKIELGLSGRLALDFGDAGQLWATGLKLLYESEGNGYRWSITAEGGLKLIRMEAETPWFVDCPGKLVIEGTKDSGHIKFESSGCAFDNIPLLIPAKIENGQPQWSTLSFRLQLVEMGKNTDGWYFKSGFRLRITRTFAQLMAILPKDGVAVELKVEKGTAAIHLKDPFLDIIVPDFSLPAVGDLPPFPMGKSRVQFGPLKLVLGKKEIGVDCGVAYRLPERTNYLLGTASGKPKIDLLDTFDPKSPDAGRAVKVSFFAGYKGGSLDIGAKVSELPLKALEKSGDHYVFNLGPVKDGVGKYGSIKFAMPQLNVDLQKGGLSLEGDFELIKDFAIPLDLLKTMLVAGSMSDWASLLPEAIPVPYLDRPPLFIGNKLNVDGIKVYYKKLMGADLPQAMINALNDLAALLKPLPERLKKYLDPPRPSGMKFKLVVRPEGSVDATLAVTPDVKLIFFSPAGGIQGITLRSFSFGELFGGQLFSLRIDADLESFDIVQLVTSLAAPESAYKYLGNPNFYGTTLELQKLFIIIVYQTEIPIPVPLFYSKLGINYYGIGDFAFQAAISFPEPSFDLQEIGTLLADLIRFVTDGKFRLDPKKKYEHFNVQFAIEPSYVTTPQVIGKQQYGLVKGWKAPSLYETFAAIANSMKFLDLRDLIAIIPLDERFHTGDAAMRVRFAGVDIEVEWLITTPREFIDAARLKMKLDPNQAQRWLAVIPGPNDTPVRPDDKGLIAYFHGYWATSYSNFEVVFGLISESVSEARMGLRISGRVSGLFDVDALAYTRVSKTPPHFVLYGESKTNLWLGALPIFSGETRLQASETYFDASGRFSLLDPQSIVYLGGSYSGHFDPNVFNLSGGLTARFLIFELQGKGSIGNTGIAGTLALGGLPPTGIEIGLQGGGVAVWGSLNLGWTVFTVGTSITPDGSAQRIDVQLTSSSIANLLQMSLAFRAMAGSLDARGTFDVLLFGTKVIGGWAELSPSSLRAGGELSFWIVPGIGLRAGVGGWISSAGFELTGNGEMQIYPLPAAACSVMIGTSGVGGKVTLIGVEYSFRIGACSGQFIIVLRGLGITSYIDSSGLHVNKNPPCSIGDTDTAGQMRGPGRLQHASALFSDVLSFAQTHFERASRTRAKEWEEIERLDEHRLLLQARRRDKLSLLLTKSAGDTEEPFFRELKQESEELLARSGRNLEKPLDIGGAYATLEITPDGESTTSLLTLFFPREAGRRREIRDRYAGLFPTYTLYERVAAALIKGE